MAFLSPYASTKEINISVVDQRGDAVPNAVLSFPSVEIPIARDSIAVMDQVDKQFSPKVLIVNKNQAVNFPNSDEIRHHVYSFSNPNDFEIKLFSGEEAAPISFEHSGVVVLGCNIHDKMIGYIYVNDGTLTTISNEQGLVSVDLPANKSVDEILGLIWHPELSLSHLQRTEITIAADKRTQTIILPFTLPEKEDSETSNTGFKRKFGR